MPDFFLHTEKELLTRISNGDEAAFRELFNHYRSKLYHYILQISESKEMAEDCVHDVFLKIWSQKELLPTIHNLNAYLYRMAHNHALNGLRSMARKTLVLAELERNDLSESPAPDETLIRKEVRQFIHSAIQQLTPQQKEVFRMSRELGLKQKDIADQLGITVPTVKRHLTDAMNFIRQEIAKTYGSYAIALFVLYHLNFPG